MQLACHTEGHLLKSVTFHTFASAGGLPHAAPTIWIELFFKKNHQYYLLASSTIGQLGRKKIR